jgi:hypothetical protein
MTMHGTAGGYTNDRCRCDLCRAAHAAKCKPAMRRRREAHAAMGRCAYCSERSVKGRTRCAGCAERDRANMARRRLDKLAVDMDADR